MQCQNQVILLDAAETLGSSADPETNVPGDDPLQRNDAWGTRLGINNVFQHQLSRAAVQIARRICQEQMLWGLSFSEQLSEGTVCCLLQLLCSTDSGGCFSCMPCFWGYNNIGAQRLVVLFGGQLIGSTVCVQSRRWKARSFEKSCNAAFGAVCNLGKVSRLVVCFSLANTFWHMFVVKRREEILRSNSVKEPQLCLRWASNNILGKQLVQLGDAIFLGTMSELIKRVQSHFGAKPCTKPTTFGAGNIFCRATGGRIFD